MPSDISIGIDYVNTDIFYHYSVSLAIRFFGHVGDTCDPNVAHIKRIFNPEQFDKRRTPGFHFRNHRHWYDVCDYYRWH